MESKRILRILIVLLALLGAAFLYGGFSPLEYSFFPRCPFRVFTGYKCPGCGSQTALHYLLNLNLADAFRSNALLITSIPYAITGGALEFIKHPNDLIIRWRKILFGEKAIYIILAIITCFWIVRNAMGAW